MSQVVSIKNDRLLMFIKLSLLNWIELTYVFTVFRIGLNKPLCSQYWIELTSVFTTFWIGLNWPLCSQYPKGIAELEYKPHWAIRGLHYDIERGLLMKIDSFLQIQFGTVYRGLTPLSEKEVLRLYKNKNIPLAYVDTHGKNHQVDTWGHFLAPWSIYDGLLFYCKILTDKNSIFQKVILWK